MDSDGHRTGEVVVVEVGAAKQEVVAGLVAEEAVSGGSSCSVSSSSRTRIKSSGVGVGSGSGSRTARRSQRSRRRSSSSRSSSCNNIRELVIKYFFTFFVMWYVASLG